MSGRPVSGDEYERSPYESEAEFQRFVKGQQRLRDLEAKYWRDARMWGQVAVGLQVFGAAWALAAAVAFIRWVLT